MSEPHTAWYDGAEEYISGAFFGLVTLDIFMFLIHCLTERTADGYSLSTLAITVPLLLVWCFQRLYVKEQEQH